MSLPAPTHLESRVVVRLATLSLQVDDPEIFLSAADRERAARFRFADDRKRMILGRWLLGDCLHRHFGFARAPLDLTYTDAGRPTLTANPEIQFSISHAGDLVGVAFACGCLVGLDLERADREVDFPALARRIMSAPDLQRFSALPTEEMPRSFFQAWTTKEAWLKACGVGISGEVRGASASSQPDFSPQPLSIASQQEQKSEWLVQGIELPQAYLGNVVWNNPEKILDFDWLPKP